MLLQRGSDVNQSSPSVQKPSIIHALYPKNNRKVQQKWTQMAGKTFPQNSFSLPKSKQIEFKKINFTFYDPFSELQQDYKFH